MASAQAIRMLLRLIVLQASLSYAAFDLGFGDDSDLTHFVSRPEIKLPRFNVTTYYPEEVTPGYWFLAPYASIVQASQPKKYVQACSTGPSIYDQNGDLVWTGACQMRNQNACDFRAWRANDTDYMSAILPHWNQLDNHKGYGIVLNNEYDVVHEIHPPRLRQFFNMHEFNIVDNGKGDGGKNAIYIGQRPQVVDLELYDQDFGDLETGIIGDLGIMEVDLNTGEQVFEWWASDHISVSQSSAVLELEDLEGPWPMGWNWLHLNAVDKNKHGDYLISSRYTDSIYKVSGQNGTILWTLAGQPRNSKFSRFILEDGFNFSRQHDARFLDETETTEVITFMDNGGDEHVITANMSSSLVVTLDKADMTARVTKRWARPGDQRSMLRGNFQLLEQGGNAFTGWSDNCHISEHSWDGKLLMEAIFSSKRFVTYRTWKANFTGNPLESPTLKAYVYGNSVATSTTAMYVSWNGATEVASWNFLRAHGENTELIASKRRTGFETSIQVFGYEGRIVAEAISGDGTVLGRSDVCVTEVTSDELALEISKLDERQQVNATLVVEDKEPIHQAHLVLEHLKTEL